MFQLRIGEKTLQTFADFRDYSCSSTAWEKSAVDFCREWMIGISFFTLKTSGSTGVPKIIEINRGQMEASSKATQAFFNTNSKTKILNVLNAEYIAGKMNLVRGMVWDCPVMLVPPSNQPINEETIRFEPDFITLVPSQIDTLLDSKKDLSRFKQILIGGAPINDALKIKIIDAGISAWQTYGMTETVSHIALAKISKEELIYEALPNVMLGTNSEGALWIDSPMSDSIQIQTNDLVKLLSPHSFQWLGRADFVINSGGVKIHPELLEKRIEPAVHSFFPVSRFLLWGEKDRLLGEKLVLIIESTQDLLKATQLMVRLKKELPKFEIPKFIYFNLNFYSSETGKILREKTAEKSLQRNDF